MVTHSAGILPFRRSSGVLEVLLVHPGGPFWANKDKHAWSIAKGECATSEALLDAARRELAEETGLETTGDLLPLGELTQGHGKVVHAWTTEQDFDPTSLRSNSFQLEWPPHSGRLCDFPEVDRAGWFTVEVAKEKLHRGQLDFLDRLCNLVSSMANRGG
jgi:predicted NUDIX family NTP pyrophosphohydrolase